MKTKTPVSEALQESAAAWAISQDLEARERISEAALDWGRDLLRRRHRGLDYDASEAVLADSILEALAKYDPEKGSRFKTWFLLILDNRARDRIRIISGSRLRKPRAKVYSLSAPALKRGAGESNCELGGAVEAPDSDPFKALGREDFISTAGKLFKRGRERTRMRKFAGLLWDGHNLKSAGEALGVSESRACQYKARLIERIRPVLGKPGRVCTTCRRARPPERFTVVKRSGKRAPLTTCKHCVNKRRRCLYRANQKVARAKKSLWEKRNPDKVRHYRAKSYWKDPEKTRAAASKRHRERMDSDPEYAAKCRERWSRNNKKRKERRRQQKEAGE